MVVSRATRVSLHPGKAQPPPALGLGLGSRLSSEWGVQALVESEEVFDAFAFRCEAYTAVETINGSVQRLMRSAEIRGRFLPTRAAQHAGHGSD